MAQKLTAISYQLKAKDHVEAERAAKKVSRSRGSLGITIAQELVR
jgi:hypothetical protein